MGLFGVKEDKKQKRNYVPNFRIVPTDCGHYSVRLGSISRISGGGMAFGERPDLFDTELDAIKAVYQIGAISHFNHILDERAVTYG